MHHHRIYIYSLFLLILKLKTLLYHQVSRNSGPVRDDPGTADQLVLITQLRERIAHLEKQLSGKDSQLLAKEKQVNFGFYIMSWCYLKWVKRWIKRSELASPAQRFLRLWEVECLGCVWRNRKFFVVLLLILNSNIAPVCMFLLLLCLFVFPFFSFSYCTLYVIIKWLVLREDKYLPWPFWFCWYKCIVKKKSQLQGLLDLACLPYFLNFWKVFNLYCLLSLVMTM